MQWTDKIRRIKIILVIAAILIAVASLVVSNILSKDLANEERARMEVWAEAMKALSHADEDTDLALVLKVLNENNTIPVIVLEKGKEVTDFRNVEIKAKTFEDSLKYIDLLAKQWYASGNAIKIPMGKSKTDFIEVCYDESLMLKRLALYPYVQLGIVMIFVMIAIFALLTSKKSEQNKVWVGLSKETAHQLGTPISSLMAWITILKENYPEDELLPEMDNDIKRLQLIADRFSKIGSQPELIPTSLNETLAYVIDYMDKRTSKKIIIKKDFPSQDIIIKINSALFQWVIENMCKNAVDAMGGAEGTIKLSIEDSPTKAIIEIADTGKGIKKKNLKNVFKPGFTTKSRGWGLGLSLAKRIIEDYHNGKIYVKTSEIGKGTTFRIELKK